MAETLDAWQRVMQARNGSVAVSPAQAAAGLGGTGNAASAAGGAPVPPADAGGVIPGVSAYGTVMANAQHAYDQAVINSRSTLIRNLRGLGFDENGQVQGNNLYGEYQLGRRQAGQEAEAATNNAAGRHLGNFGGLADQARNEATFRGGAAMAGTLGRAELAGAQSAGEIQAANFTLQDRLAQAQIDAARQAIEDRQFNLAADPTGTGTPSTAPPSVKAALAAATVKPALRNAPPGAQFTAPPKPAAKKPPAPKFVAPQRRA